MLLTLTIVAFGTFAALVIRRLKLDIEQERAFRAKLSGAPTTPNGLISLSGATVLHGTSR